MASYEPKSDRYRLYNRRIADLLEPAVASSTNFPRLPSTANSYPIMAESRSGESTPRPAETSEAEQTKDGKKKRSLFGFGKKKTGDSTKAEPTTNTPSVPRESSKASPVSQPTASPSHNDIAAAATPVSPTRALSGSPRIASPARSQIFERDVQESTTLPPNSPAIPTHIQTENHIPPVLDEASEAITNSKLDPDSVEIVTHNSHQPAGLNFTTTTSPPSAASPHETSQQPGEWTEELTSFSNRQIASPADSASHYGSLDSTDVRRLSFISFADVVQSEQGGGFGMAGSRDSIHVAGLTSIPSGINRSPSPVLSPVSSQGPGTSPPTSSPGSVKGLELSPSRKPLVSPTSGLSLAPAGELNIETMSQALRRTGSADLSQVRSMPTSPIEGPGSR